MRTGVRVPYFALMENYTLKPDFTLDGKYSLSKALERFSRGLCIVFDCPNRLKEGCRVCEQHYQELWPYQKRVLDEL